MVSKVARECDFGCNDTTFIVQTHLGHMLKAGDTAWGYDLGNAVVDIRNEHNLEKLGYAAPDVVLVRKFEEVSERGAARRRRQKRRIAFASSVGSAGNGGGSGRGGGSDKDGEAEEGEDEIVDSEDGDEGVDDAEEAEEGGGGGDDSSDFPQVSHAELLEIQDVEDSRHFDKYTFEEES